MSTTDSTDSLSVAPVRRGPGTLKRLTRDPGGLFGVVVLFAMALVAIFGPSLTPQDPNASQLIDRLQGPTAAHWFGTDDLGRDLFSRMVVGARISLLASIQAIAVALLVGLPTGLVAGYSGGIASKVFNAGANLLMSFPPIVLAITVIAVLGAGLTNAMIAIGLIFAPRLFRIIRAAAREVSSETYVEYARAAGVPAPVILWRHVLRNVMGPLIVYGSFAMGTALLIEAALSFLGLGVQPPDASWGAMLGRGFRNIYSDASGVIFPGGAITLVVLSFNLVGDGLRDALGMKGRR